MKSLIKFLLPILISINAHLLFASDASTAAQQYHDESRIIFSDEGYSLSFFGPNGRKYKLLITGFDMNADDALSVVENFLEMFRDRIVKKPEEGGCSGLLDTFTHYAGEPDGRYR